MADDDPDDRLLFRVALEDARLCNIVDFTEDGQDLLDYLHRHGRYQELARMPLPDLILLDLNMPRMDGREALREIKLDPKLRRIPIVVLTSSAVEEDILHSYNLGASSFITKPVTFESLITVVRAVTDYWFNIVRLPAQ